MIDEKLIALVTETKAKLESMSDAPQSELRAVRQKFAKDFVDLLEHAGDDISDDHKIAMFDVLLENRVQFYKEAIKNWMDGKGYFEDEDAAHYAAEDVQTATLGDASYEATNELEDILLS